MTRHLWFTVTRTMYKSQLSQTDPRDALHNAHVLCTKVDAQCDELATVQLKLGTHYPCPWAVSTGVKNDTRAHGTCWSPAYPTRPVNTAVIFCHFLTPVFTGHGHG